MLSQEYPSVPKTVIDNLSIKENYFASEATESRRATHKILSIHRFFGSVFNDGMNLESKTYSFDEVSCEHAFPLSTMKSVKSGRSANGKLSVICEDSIFDTETDYDETNQHVASSFSSFVSSASSGHKKSFMERILEVKDKIPALHNDVHVHIASRNDILTCEVAPQGYMDVHEFLKPK
ncbi:unnamed protein product [Ambrosiozyma monospora]|uniref:Unnamed protein product n=1 Tax=Ambrosiozyma monospora TaxID=43982 RepID=A0ACB5T2W5_AMBMO|nr:unnamed protein product [Ambrosiozyma monospora]